MTRQFGSWAGMGVAVAVVGTMMFVSSILLSGPALAASAKEIDVGVDEALVKFEKEVKGGKDFIEHSKGLLVFPQVIKGGAGFGGEYGQGALRIDGKTVDYYSTL